MTVGGIRQFRTVMRGYEPTEVDRALGDLRKAVEQARTDAANAGVAVTNLFPEGRTVVAWLRYGWHVALAYVVGFAVMLTLVGWHPHTPHKAAAEPATSSAAR